MSDKEFLLEEPVLSPEEEAGLRGETYVSTDDDDQDEKDKLALEKTKEAGDQDDLPTGTPVPYPRFHEVNEKAKAAEAAKAAAEAEAQSLREQLAEAQKQDPVAQQQQQQQPVSANDVAEYKSARKKMMDEARDYELLGETDKYDELQDKIMDLDIDFNLRKSAESAIAVQRQTREQTVFQDTITVLEKTYPVIDINNQSHNPKMIEAVNDRYEILQARGVPKTDALRQATEFVMDLAGIQPAGTQAPVADTRNKADIRRNADAASRQPPKMHAGMGDRAISSSEKRIKDMSDAEFENLDPEKEKKLRGEA